MVDRHTGELGQQHRGLLVLVAELAPPSLLGQVQVAVRLAVDQDRHAEEQLHRRMADRETVGVGMAADVVDPQRLRIADQLSEHPAAGRKRPDRPPRRLIDSGGQEPARVRVRDSSSTPSAAYRAPVSSRAAVEHAFEHDLDIELLEHAARDCQDCRVAWSMAPPVRARLTATIPHANVLPTRRKSRCGSASSRPCSRAYATSSARVDGPVLCWMWAR